MRNVLIIVLISAIVGMSACSDDPSESIIEPTTEELETKVIENCRTLEAALEEFASYNDEHCPVDIYSDTNDLGLTVIDYLPGGELMENPFTGERTEPVDTVAAEPGQTGYYLKSPLYLYRALYSISGFGESDIIMELSNAEELEQKVIENCFIVREAVMRFAMLNGGVYPYNLGTDVTPEGDTVTNLLPGGVLLENPFSYAATEPCDGNAYDPGEVSYVPVYAGVSLVGFTIKGVGAVPLVTIFTASTEPSCTYISIYGERAYCSGDCCE